MDIILVTVVFPYPINDGGRSGTFKMIEFLRNKHNITLVCPSCTVENHQKLHELWPNVKILTFKGQDKIKGFDIKGLIKGLARKDKISKLDQFKQNMVLNKTDLVKFYFANLIELFLAELATKTYDLVQVDFIELAPLVHFIPENLPKIFVHHELRYIRMAQEYATLDYKDYSEEWKIQNTKILEIGLLSKFDKVICLSKVDKGILVSEGLEETKVEVSQLPVDIIEHPINQPFQFKNKLVFLGPDIHFPNLDGIDWFLNNCWVNLLKKQPNLQLHITGKWSEDAKKMFVQFPNLYFKGFVHNLSGLMEGAIMIIPLRIGSGMRMKILEGAAWHVPMVSTSVGAEGLPMVNQENCILADSSQDFIEGILRLLKDEPLQNELVNVAKKIIKSGYSVEECGQIRERIYKETSRK
jgi:glycosyltransferase involved in cell wall biosynthesis